MKILVTGGAGFIGSHICDALLADAHEIAVIDNLSSGRHENLAEGIKLHRLDIRSQQASTLIESISPDVIVHTAAQISVRESMDRPDVDADINVLGLINILRAIKHPASTQVVFLSTGGAIYGEQENFPANEQHAILPTSFYGLSKRVGEMYLDLWGRTTGLTVTCLRLANIYGPRQNPHGEAGVVAIFCQKLLKQELPVINGSGEQTRDFTFVGDVARAVAAVVKQRVPGTFNIGTAVETSINQLSAEIVNALGAKIKIGHAEAKPGEQLRSCIDPGHAERTFGWKPSMQLGQGIKLTAAWFKQQ